MLRVRISSPAFVFHHRPFRCIIAALIVLGMHVCGCTAVYGSLCPAHGEEHGQRHSDSADELGFGPAFDQPPAAPSDSTVLALTAGQGEPPCNCSSERWPMTVEISRTSVPAPDLAVAVVAVDVLPVRVAIRPARMATADTPRRTSSLLRLHCALLI
ncbi:MAG: hypothetical protein ACREJO_01040 [Phycisphaerales bacterium]